AEGVFQNFYNNSVSKINPRTDTAKVDHNLSDKVRLSFSIANDSIDVLSPDGGNSSNKFPNIRQHEETTGMAGNARANVILSPRSTNEASFAIKRYDVHLLLQDNGAPSVRPAGLTIRDFFPHANTLRLAPGIMFGQGW